MQEKLETSGIRVPSYHDISEIEIRSYIRQNK